MKKVILIALLFSLTISCKKATEVEDSCTDLSERPIGDDTNYVRIIGLMPFPPDGEHEKILLKDFKDLDGDDVLYYSIKHQNFFDIYNDEFRIIDLLPGDKEKIKCVQPWDITHTSTINYDIARDFLNNDSDSLILLNPNGWINQKVKYENAKQGEWIFF